MESRQIGENKNVSALINYAESFEVVFIHF